MLHKLIKKKQIKSAKNTLEFNEKFKDNFLENDISIVGFNSDFEEHSSERNIVLLLKNNEGNIDDIDIVVNGDIKNRVFTLGRHFTKSEDKLLRLIAETNIQKL